MSDELASELRATITELKGELAKVKDESMNRRSKLKEYKETINALAAERDELAGQVESFVAEHNDLLTAKEEEIEAAATERDEWKTLAEAGPDGAAKELGELRMQIRKRDHRDAWDKEVADALNTGATVEKLWRDIDYTPGENVPTPEEIREQIKGARDAAPYLFKQTLDATSGAAAGAANGVTPGGANSGARPTLKVAESPSRGGRDTTTGRVTYKRSETQVPGWQTENPGLAKAIAAKEAVVLPE